MFYGDLMELSAPRSAVVQTDRRFKRETGGASFSPRLSSNGENIHLRKQFAIRGLDKAGVPLHFIKKQSSHSPVFHLKLC